MIALQLHSTSPATAHVFGLLPLGLSGVSPYISGFSPASMAARCGSRKGGRARPSPR